MEIIKELLAYNNIVFIQEHWQFEEQLHKLNIDNGHMVIAVSGMDSSSHIQLGRPYGGVTIIPDKDINNYIQSMDTESLQTKLGSSEDNFSLNDKLNRAF